MRAWILSAMLLATVSVVPTVQACTAAPPSPLPDFHRLDWRNETITTIWGGREVFLDVPSRTWSIGEERTHRHGCDPGPKRAGVVDPDGAWSLEYDDHAFMGSGRWTLGPLQLRADGEVVHGWDIHTSWMAFDPGVLVRGGGLDWVAFGQTAVEARQPHEGIWGRYDGETAFFLGSDLMLVDVATAADQTHPYPAGLGGAVQWWPSSDGIVVQGAQGLAWFNGTFGSAFPVDGSVHLLHDAFASSVDGNTVVRSRHGAEAAWDGVWVHTSATGGARSVVAVRSEQVPQLWILDGVEVTAKVPMPQGSNGASGTSGTSSSTGPHEDGTTTSISEKVPMVLPLLALVAVLALRRW